MLNLQKKEKIIKLFIIMENKNISPLDWLIHWYKSNCNGDWEHDYGILIETIDNPGWSLVIDIENINYNLNDIEWKYFEKNSNDWYGYGIFEGKFQASGDINKLEYLIIIFKNIILNLK